MVTAQKSTILKKPKATLFIVVASIVAVAFLAFTGLIYVLSPKMPVVQRLVSNYTEFGLFLICTVPFVAFSVFIDHRWGWYTFIIYSSLLAIFSLYQLQFYTGTIAFYAIILLNIANFAGVTFFVSESIRAPYFSDEDRGWRLSKRMPLSLPVKITKSGSQQSSFDTRTLDISETGLMFDLPKKEKANTGDAIEMELQLSDLGKINLKGEVVRIIAESGFKRIGVRLSNNDADTVKRFANFLKERYANRYKFEVPVNLVNSQNTIAGKSWNLSRTGCFVETDKLNLKVDDSVSTEIHYSDSKKVIRPGRIVWINSQSGNSKKGKGFGIEFSDSIYLKPSFALFYFFNVRKNPLRR